MCCRPSLQPFVRVGVPHVGSFRKHLVLVLRTYGGPRSKGRKSLMLLSRRLSVGHSNSLASKVKARASLQGTAASDRTFSENVALNSVSFDLGSSFSQGEGKTSKSRQKLMQSTSQFLSSWSSVDSVEWPGGQTTENTNSAFDLVESCQCSMQSSS